MTLLASYLRSQTQKNKPILGHRSAGTWARDCQILYIDAAIVSFLTSPLACKGTVHTIVLVQVA